MPESEDAVEMDAQTGLCLISLILPASPYLGDVTLSGILKFCLSLDVEPSQPENTPKPEVLLTSGVRGEGTPGSPLGPPSETLAPVFRSANAVSCNEGEKGGLPRLKFQFELSILGDDEDRSGDEGNNKGEFIEVEDP